MAMTTYFEIAGRIDPFDLLGFPDFVPRLTRWKVRPMLRYFDEAVNAIIVARRSALACSRRRRPPRDLLSALLSARDPETGEATQRDRGEGQRLDLHRRRPGDDGQRSDLGPVPAVAIAGMAGSGFGRGRDRVRRPPGRTRGPADGHARGDRRDAAALSADHRHQPHGRPARRSLGRRIEPGTLIVIAPYVLHRHRLLWDQPDLFDPSRFLMGAATKIERGAYIPFGVGPRMCLGASFAHQEATIALASLVKNFELRMTPGQSVWPQQGITLRRAIRC